MKTKSVFDQLKEKVDGNFSSKIESFWNLVQA